VTRLERQLIDELTAISGLHPVIVDFVVYCGFRVLADQSLEEQVRIVEIRFGLSRSECLDLIADNFRDAVNEFYNEAFPVAGSSRN
jgi:hypothetical protein